MLGWTLGEGLRRAQEAIDRLISRITEVLGEMDEGA